MPGEYDDLIQAAQGQRVGGEYDDLIAKRKKPARAPAKPSTTAQTALGMVPFAGNTQPKPARQVHHALPAKMAQGRTPSQMIGTPDDWRAHSRAVQGLQVRSQAGGLPPIFQHRTMQEDTRQAAQSQQWFADRIKPVTNALSMMNPLGMPIDAIWGKGTNAGILNTLAAGTLNAPTNAAHAASIAVTPNNNATPWDRAKATGEAVLEVGLVDGTIAKLVGKGYKAVEGAVQAKKATKEAVKTAEEAATRAPGVTYRKKLEKPPVAPKPQAAAPKVVSAEPTTKPLTVYRAGGERGLNAEKGGPTFYATQKEGSLPFADGDVTKVREEQIAPRSLFDTKTNANHRAIYEAFLKETAHPGRYGNTARPFWTTEHDLRKWLDKNGHDFDAVMFDEPTGVPSVAVYNRTATGEGVAKAGGKTDANVKAPVSESGLLTPETNIKNGVSSPLKKAGTVPLKRKPSNVPPAEPSVAGSASSELTPTRRLEVLRASLAKKEAEFDRKFAAHMEDVRSANGQPLNDKRNGASTMSRWDQQDASLRRQKEEIEKTKAAIEREQNAIARVDASEVHPVLEQMAQTGELARWRKHPHTFFVPGVDKARIVWDKKTGKLGVRYADAVPKEQFPKLKEAFSKAKQAIADYKELPASEGTAVRRAEAWQRTKNDFVAERSAMPGWDKHSAEAMHVGQIQRALKEGKPVPQEVLADYPDLASKQPRKAQAEAPLVKSRVKVAKKPSFTPAEKQSALDTYNQRKHLYGQAKQRLDSDPNNTLRELEEITAANDLREAEKRLKELGVDVPSQIPAATPKVKAPSAKPAGPTPSGPRVSKPVGDGKPKDVFGLATRFEEDASRGKKGVSVEDLQKAGKDLHDSGKVTPQSIYDKLDQRKPLTPEDGAVAAYRGQVIKNRLGEIESELDSGLDPVTHATRMQEKAVLREELERIYDAGTDLQRSFHWFGQSLKIATKPDFSLVSLQREIDNIWKVTGDEAAPPHFHAQVKDLSSKLKTAEADAKAARAEVEELLAKLSQTRGGMRSKNPAVRKEALKRGILSDLGLGKPTTEAGPKRSKQSGAFNIPQDAQKRLQAKANALTRIYIEEGATSVDEILARFRKELPMLDEDTVLGLLSGKYREKILQADIKRTEINEALRKVKAGAEWKQKSVMRKTLDVTADALLSFGRQIQTAGDFGGMMLQGLPSAFVSPSSFGKGWGQMARVVTNQEKGIAPGLHSLARVFSGEQAYQKSMAIIRSDPAYPYAKRVVSFTDLDGSLTVQEEQIAGHLLDSLRKVRIKIKGKEIPVPVVGQAAGALQRTNQGFAAALNRLRMDLFKKFVNGQWDNADAIADAGRLANILSGRGDGTIAKALSHKFFGYVGYAPRFMLSTYQNAMLPLLLPTFKTTGGRVAAMSAWSKQATGVLGALYVANKLGESKENGGLGIKGFSAETDIRAKTYGTIYTPWGSFQLFKKITDPAMFVGQQLGGTITKKGDYYPPNMRNNASSLGYYLSGKASPAARIATQVAAGERYDDDGKIVPFDPTDWEKGIKPSLQNMTTPIGAQEAMRNGGGLDAWLFGLFNINYKPKEETVKLGPNRPKWRHTKQSKVSASKG